MHLKSFDYTKGILYEVHSDLCQKQFEDEECSFHIVNLKMLLIENFGSYCNKHMCVSKEHMP